jgi:tetratricopeptide (TPR) repeat protein
MKTTRESSRSTRAGLHGRGGGARTAVVAVLAAAAAGFGGYFLARELGAGPPRAEEAPTGRPQAPIASPSERRPVGTAPGEDPERAAKRGWVEANNRANALLDAGELEAAVELFARCFAAVPTDDVFRRNLAEARFRLATRLNAEHELALAIDELARAVEVAPERAELVELLARWRRELELAAGDTVALGSYFKVEYDDSRADIVQHAQEVLDFLEGGGRYGQGAYETLRGVFRADPVLMSDEKIRVVLYDRAEFDRLTGLGDWAGGVFDGVIRVAVDDLTRERSRWERILRHELVHAFVRDVGGRDVPGWLNEGLAQYFEEPTPGLAEARATLAGTELFPLERLRESLATWKNQGEIARAYAQSLAFVAFLRDTVGDGGLAELLAACRAQGAVEGTRSLAGVPLDAYLSDLAVQVGARR